MLNATVMDLVKISRRLAAEVDKVRFSAPTSHVYNPLVYARAPHERYLERYGQLTGRVVLVGMNPGPFGMAQTGVPFGDVTMVRDFLGIEERVGKPAREHPARPISGFACARCEISGTRLWGWARDRYGEAKRFFHRFFVINYCPLVFMEDSGRNRTPDKLAPAERERLFAACDRALYDAAALLRPTHVVGVGAFAEGRARTALGETSIRIGGILHPSPASPAANRDWAAQAERQLQGLGIDVGCRATIGP